jgi:hypothetical protein
MVRLERPSYFKIDFSVSPFGATGGLPENFQTDAELAKGTQTYSFDVVMEYIIEREHSNFAAEEYAKWAEALFSALRERVPH